MWISIRRKWLSFFFSFSRTPLIHMSDFFSFFVAFFIPRHFFGLYTNDISFAIQLSFYFINLISFCVSIISLDRYYSSKAYEIAFSSLNWRKRKNKDTEIHCIQSENAQHFIKWFSLAFLSETVHFWQICSSFIFHLSWLSLSDLKCATAFFFLLAYTHMNAKIQSNIHQQ